MVSRVEEQIKSRAEPRFPPWNRKVTSFVSPVSDIYIYIVYGFNLNSIETRSENSSRFDARRHTPHPLHSHTRFFSPSSSPPSPYISARLTPATWILTLRSGKDAIALSNRFEIFRYPKSIFPLFSFLLEKEEEEGEEDSSLFFFYQLTGHGISEDRDISPGIKSSAEMRCSGRSLWPLPNREPCLFPSRCGTMLSRGRNNNLLMHLTISLLRRYRSPFHGRFSSTPWN